ncbi:MAG: 16S rRNA (uracil(1498)-N(3))-methyltransferase [Bacteroidetes bacterium]|nr:16S rRNA (uracil(1498)-N(3))-methyltransferase [Bacteroidota bacterium]
MSAYLSNIELYFTEPKNVGNTDIFMDNSDAKHIQKVMRHKIGDKIFITDGKGKIYEGEIEEIKNGSLKITKFEIREYPEKYKNITLCIPNLRKTNRLEFAIEKATELGITNFIIFNSKRTFPKKVKIDRLNKIALSAMKQSLNSYLPKITFHNSLSFLKETNFEIVLFDQANKSMFNSSSLNTNKNYFLLFGPEGGFEDCEIPENIIISNFNLAPIRLRTETAVICAISKLST